MFFSTQNSVMSAKTTEKSGKKLKTQHYSSERKKLKQIETIARPE